MLADPEIEEDFRQLAVEEIKELEARKSTLLDEIKDTLVMADDAAIDSVIVEIRPGTGGDEAALFARERTGKGQVVDTSLMGSVIAALGLIMAAPAVLGQEFPREIRAEGGNPLYNHYRNNFI